MNPTIMTVRAVSAEFARRIARPLLILGGIIVLVLLLCGGWLTTISAWWWLLEAVFIGSALLFLILVIVSNFVLRSLAPALSKVQKAGTKEFVDKLQRVSDNLGTPKFVILFRIVRDTLQRREHGFIESFSNDTASLQSDFLSLKRLFDH